MPRPIQRDVIQYPPVRDGRAKLIRHFPWFASIPHSDPLVIPCNLSVPVQPSRGNSKMEWDPEAKEVDRHEVADHSCKLIANVRFSSVICEEDAEEKGAYRRTIHPSTKSLLAFSSALGLVAIATPDGTLECPPSVFPVSRRTSVSFTANFNLPTNPSAPRAQDTCCWRLRSHSTRRWTSNRTTTTRSCLLGPTASPACSCSSPAPPPPPRASPR